MVKPARRGLASALALVAALAPSPALAQGDVDPLDALARWTRRYERSRSELADEEVDALEQRVAEARMLAIAVPGRQREVARALLDLAAARPAGPAFAPELPSALEGQAAHIRELATSTLGGLLAGERGKQLARWLAASVLARADSQPLERRLAAAETLRGRYLSETRLALFACAVEPERRLREAAMLALEGWPDDVVHRFLLDQLRRAAERPGWISPRVVRRHFAAVRIESQSPAASALSEHLRAALAGQDWRAAFRALELSPALPEELAVPALVDALEDWGRRRALGTGRLRLEGDLVAELQRRSGRRIGLFPGRWRLWWESRRAARERDEPEPDATQTTRADFFGLRPLTDRVVFVLDRSFSMNSDFAGGARTRHEEAIEQLMGLLEGMGEATRFRVLLFSGDVHVWSDRLKPATPANLRAVRGWLEARRPNGATRLLPGIAEALRLDGRGGLDLARLEADTVIVLCDGATEEGPAWVRPLLAGPGEAACMRFHSVLIGSGGDGTLELLAAESGGEFVRVVP